MSEADEWRKFLRDRAYQGPPMEGRVCLEHGVANLSDPNWTCWMCEVTTKNPGCAKGCTAGTDAYYCTESPPSGDCSCKCHATGDLDVW